MVSYFTFHIISVDRSLAESLLIIFSSPWNDLKSEFNIHTML